MKNALPTFSYSITNSAKGEIDIHIDGDIVDASTQAIWKEWFGDDTSTSFKSFREKLNAVEGATVYNVYINSGGGIVTDAMAIHDLLRSVQSKGITVNTIGRGIIASAATYILMAGNNPSMSKNSWFMIHNVGGGVWGDVNTVEQYAGTLRKFNNRSRDFYAEFTGMSKDDIDTMMNAETWMTADEAKAKGFIKQIEGEVPFEQKIPQDKWAFANMAVLNAYNSSVKQPPETPATTELHSLIIKQSEDMKKFFQDLGASIMNAVKGIPAPENNDHGTLMNSIGEAIKKTFEQSAEQMEAAVNEVVNATSDFTKEGEAKTKFDAAVKNSIDAQLPEAVKTAVDNATKEMGEKITGLESVNSELKKKNEDLEQEILNLKGGKSVVNDGGNAVKEPVGSFSE